MTFSRKFTTKEEITVVVVVVVVVAAAAAAVVNVVDVMLIEGKFTLNKCNNKLCCVSLV